MGKEKALTVRSFIGDLFRVGVYKRNQGRIARQATCAAIWVTFVIGVWRMWVEFGTGSNARYFWCTGLLGIGLWLGYRIVNVPQFADFLVAVEAEMNKVSWPSRPQLVRSSIVVIFVIFAMAVVLFGFDLVWQQLFSLIGVRPR